MSFSTPPEVIIDCGANIALSAVYFANRFRGAKIIAIEPDENNFAFLKKNTWPYPNGICLQKAVWPYQQQLEIVDPGKAVRDCKHESFNGIKGIIDTIAIDEITARLTGTPSTF